MNYNLIGNFFEDEEDEIMESELKQSGLEAVTEVEPESVKSEEVVSEVKPESIKSEGDTSEVKPESIKSEEYTSYNVGHVSEPISRERGQELLDESMMNKDEEYLLYGGGASASDYAYYGSEDASDEGADAEDDTEDAEDAEDWSYLTSDIDESLDESEYEQEEEDFSYLMAEDEQPEEDDYSNTYEEQVVSAEPERVEVEPERVEVEPERVEVEPEGLEGGSAEDWSYLSDDEDEPEESGYEQIEEDFSYLMDDEQSDEDEELSEESSEDWSYLSDSEEESEDDSESGSYSIPQPAQEPVKACENNQSAVESKDASETDCVTSKDESLSSEDNSQNNKSIIFNFNNEVSELSAKNKELENENEELKKQLTALRNEIVENENRELKKQLAALRSGVVEHEDSKETRESNLEGASISDSNRSGNGDRASDSNVTVISDGAVQHKTEGSRVVTKPKLKLSKDDFAKMPPNQLFRYVESYAVRNGIASRTLTKEELVSKFGEVAINNLLRSRQGYLIRTKNNTFTLGNV